MSGVSRVADEVRKVQMEAAVVTAQAESAKETLRTQMASFSVQAEVSAEQVAERMEGWIQALASHAEAQMSQVAREVIQRLEKEIEAVATSTAVTAEGRTRDAMQELRHNFQANMERNQAESCHREETMQKSVMDLAAKLNILTQQLNDFRLMREAEAIVGAEKLFDSVDARLQTHSVRMDQMFQSMQDTRKESAANAKTIQTLLISIENLSDNFQRMREDMIQWNEPVQPIDESEEREYQATVQEILKEVSLPTAGDHTAVTVAQFSAPVFGPSLVNPALPMDVSEGTSLSVPIFNSPVQQTTTSGF